MSQVDRRKFLRDTAAAGGGALLWHSLYAGREVIGNDGGENIAPSDYGVLAPAAATNTGEVLLALPKGFRYNVFGRTGTLMSDNRATPKAHDGMGVFEYTGNLWTLIRNHEVQDFAGTPGTVNGPNAYDPAAGGGATQLVIDKTTRLPVDTGVALAGTVRNCSGAVTPWRSWLSCEETVAGTGAGFAKPHGYCFEVFPNSPSAPPVPLTQMGRFMHEGAAVDRRTGVVYLTEDNPAGTSGFYRYVPNTYGKLAGGGKLQILKIRGQNNYDARTGQTPGLTLLADWTDITDPDPADAETNPAAVFLEGYAAGAALFGRLEGCQAEFDRIVFIATTGGNAGLGQVWEYRHRKGNSGRLKLLYESAAAPDLNVPDNVAFGPRGNIFMTEDNGAENHIRFLTPAGVTADFARNLVPEFTTFEFAGICFTPGHSTMFVNVQTPGITFAIWGPW